MKKIIIISTVVAVIATILSIKIPKVDYAHSDFSVVCTKFSKIYGFHLDPELVAVKEGTTFRQNGYEVNDKFYDVFLKVKCGQGPQSAEDTRRLMTKVQTDYDNKAIPESFINGPVNYTIQLQNATYNPSYTEFILKIVLLAGLVVGGIMVGRRII